MTSDQPTEYVAVDALLEDALCDSLAEITGASIEGASFKDVLRTAIRVAQENYEQVRCACGNRDADECYAVDCEGEPHDK